MSVFDDGPVLLDGPEIMQQIHRELSGPVYRGSVESWYLDGEVRWRLHLNDDKGNKIVSGIDQSDGALLGEYLHLVYGRLLVLSADEVTA